jgi:hypothetical protein
MSRGTRWKVAGFLYAFINIAGAGYAIAMGEWMHAGAHAFLLLLGVGAYFAWQAAPRETQPVSTVARQAMSSLDNLQQSVDAIALEVERIGEAQRFETKLVQERMKNSVERKEE